MEWIATDQLAADAVKLAGLLPPDTARIVGVPRSGMIPASIVATMLHLPLWELTMSGLRRLAPGSRGYLEREGKTVVIDDTVYGGHAMRRAKAVLPADTLYAAVYIRPDKTHEIDFHVRPVDARSHLLEWNFFDNHQIQAAGVAYDFDGVLCHDPTVPDSDGGSSLEVYRQWLMNARPLYLPRAQPVTLIVTARLETFRRETEDWLKRHGIRWGKLVMNQADRASQRGDVAGIKARHYLEHRPHCAYFIESCPHQAERIFQLTGKQVICPGARKVWAR